MTAETSTTPRPLLGLIAAGGVGGFVVAFLVAGAVAPGYSPVHEYISALAVRTEPHAWIMTVGFGLLALGTIAAGLALIRRLAGTAGRIGGLLVLLAGVGIVGSATFRLDCSPTVGSCAAREVAGTVSTGHVLHNLVSLLSHVLLVVALLVLARALRRTEGLRYLARPTLLLGLAGVAYVGCLVGTDLGGAEGIVQRVAVVALYGWPAWLALAPVRGQRPLHQTSVGRSSAVSSR